MRVLLAWAGDDPRREGLLETPARVVRAYEEFFAGYSQDPEEILAKTFEEIELMPATSTTEYISVASTSPSEPRKTDTPGP